MTQKLLYKLSRVAVSIYARLMLQLDVHCKAALPTCPKLIVANHPSMSDPIYLPLISPQPVKILITNSPFTLPVLGTYLRRSGHVPVVPGNGRPAFDAAHRLLRGGDSVAIFPEGLVSPQQGGFNRPRTGAARLALLTGVPVVPVGIYLPRERNRTIAANIEGRDTVGYWYFRGPYSVTVGDPLHFEGDVEDRDHVTLVTGSIMQHIISLADQSEQRTKGRLGFCPV